MTRTLASRARRGTSMLVVLATATTVAACSFPRPLPAGNIAGGPGAPVTYYVSPSGNDAAAGTSPSTAWRTLRRASAQVLPPGSRLLLQGGQRFTGELELNQRDGGDAARPVVISSYGAGQATIVSPAGDGILVLDTAGVDISDLRMAGHPEPGGGGPPGSGDIGAGNAGIALYSNLPAGHRLAHVSISGVDVTGYVYGISVGGRNRAAGFSDVRITDSDLHGNLDSGFESYGGGYTGQQPSYANENIQISHVLATHNPGDPRDKARNTGNGIVLGSVRNGSVTWSTASYNGGAGGASEGPEGIWTYDSTGVVIAHDLSYDNKTANKIDGNGFGIDQNTSDTVLEDNLSYGNYGSGYLIYSSVNNGAEVNNVLRNNISSEDDRDGNTFYAGISVIGRVQAATVEQNTVVMMPTARGASPALRLGPALHGVAVRNNIFSSQAGPLVSASAITPAQAVLQGNDYFSVPGPWTISWGSTAYHSLAAFRAGTGQETVSGIPSGLEANPEMVGPVVGLDVTNPGQLGGSVGREFSLAPGSPLAGAGLDLASLGSDPASTNFAGARQSRQHPDVGAL